MPTALSLYSDAELQAELKRRERNSEVAIPQILDDPDTDALLQLLDQHLQDIARDSADEDMPHYIYEAALEAWYGKDVWRFINARS